jgi:hypothetical protein
MGCNELHDFLTDRAIMSLWPCVYLDSAILTSALAVVESADSIQDGAGPCMEARQ